MTEDSPTPLGGGRTSPKKSGSPGQAAAVLEEQRRELEKLRAELEEERARGRAERRRFAAQARRLREAAERERQQLADHLRSKWEAQRFRELRQLQAEVQREREAEIRQLLRWKEAELRQLQQLLGRERDGVVRQARELQRQLAQELVNRGYCSHTEAPELPAAQCRCRLQEVLRQLRWETDGEQAARIRHLQAALDVERQLFLKYILEHFRWQPALPGPPDSQAENSSEEPLPETSNSARRTPEPALRLRHSDSLRAGIRVRSRSLERSPEARSCSPDGRLPARASSLDSLTTARSCSLDSTLSCPKASESEAPTDTSLEGPPNPSQPRAHRKPKDWRGGEGSGNQPPEGLTLSPLGSDYRALVRRNSELSEALQGLARRCSELREENLQLRRGGGFRDEAEKVKRLKMKHAELAGLARRLEDRARKLQETNLRALSAPVPGENSASLELCQALARQRAKDLSEQASALLAKDKQIEELRRECHLLQARVANGLCSPSHPAGGVPRAQWLNLRDLDLLQRESQREVLRLQRQLTLQQGKCCAQAEADSQSAPCEEVLHQVQALERELDARRRECEALGAQAAAAQRRSEEAEAQLQAALHKGAWLAEENERLQAQAHWVGKVAAENSDVRGQLGRACQERDAAGLLAEQLLQQAALGQNRQQQLQHDLEKALSDLQAARKEMQALQDHPGHPPQQPQEATQAPVSQATGREIPTIKPQTEDRAPSQPSTEQPAVCPIMQESPVAFGEPASSLPVSDRVPADQPLDSRHQAKTTNSQSTTSSEVESIWATVPSCLTLDMDTASEVDDLEPDSVSPPLDVRDPEAPSTSKLKIFQARYSYNPFEGPSEHPEGELPLTAGDYVYVFGDLDENGFYEGELEDGRRGLVPSNLVEQIPDSPNLSNLSLKSPESPKHLGPTILPVGQSKASKEDSVSLREAQGSVKRGACQMGREGAKIEKAVLEIKREACRLDSPQSIQEEGFCITPLGTKGLPCVGPMQLHLQSITATSAKIAWVYGSGRHPHLVYLDDQEHALTPSGVSCYTFQGLHPGTQYQARVEVGLPWDLLQVPWETMSSTITFNTPLAGPPDPPLDVLVEHHTLPGFLVVSWIPVTIDSAGSSNGVQVTGYAVYADGLKVAEVTDATAGSTLLEFSQLEVPLTCQKVSVRTMSLCGESLDSVPAQIPEDCFTYYSLPETLPFSDTCGDPSSFGVTFPIYHQKMALASLSIKPGPHTPGSCGEPQAKSPEELPEEPLRRQPPLSNLSSEEAGKQARGPAGAQKGCRKDLQFQNHRPLLPSGQSVKEENHCGHMSTSRDSSPGFIHPSPKCGPRKELCQEKAALEKALRQKQGAQVLTPSQQGTSQQCAADSCNILQEEVCLDPWCTEEREQREKLRPQSRQEQAMRGRKECQLCEPTSVLSPAPSSKVINMSGGAPLQLEPEANTPARIFVALFDYNPLVMSANPEAAEELAFQKGQLLRVWGSQDPRGFYHGEYNGQVGNIPGHLVAEVEAGTEQPDRRWHLLAQGHLPSVDHSEDSEGLTTPQGSFPRSQGNCRRPMLWTPKTMMVALDYDPKDRRAGGRAKGKLALRAGDVVTVYGPVDDKGFYYGELGGHRGLIPAHLLDDLSVPRE